MMIESTGITLMLRSAKRAAASDFRAARSQKWIGLTAAIGAAAFAILMVAV